MTTCWLDFPELGGSAGKVGIVSLCPERGARIHPLPKMLHISLFSLQSTLFFFLSTLFIVSERNPQLGEHKREYLHISLLAKSVSLSSEYSAGSSRRAEAQSWWCASHPDSELGDLAPLWWGFCNLETSQRCKAGFFLSGSCCLVCVPYTICPTPPPLTTVLSKAESIFWLCAHAYKTR